MLQNASSPKERYEAENANLKKQKLSQCKRVTTVLKKGALIWTLFPTKNQRTNYIPRQVAGSKRATTVVPSVPRPQTQLPIVPPAAIAVPVDDNGLKVTMPPGVPVAVLLIPWLVTEITPAVDVVIEATYLEIAVPETDSQPHAFGTVGKDVPLCTDSVIEALQLDATKITSLFLARTVYS